MVGVFAEPGFFARELLEMAFRTLRPPLLQALAQGMMALARLLNGFSAECLALAIGSQMNDTQINTESFISSDRRRCGNIEGHRQIEHPMAVQQIGLPLDSIHACLLIVAHLKRNQNTSREG